MKRVMGAILCALVFGPQAYAEVVVRVNVAVESSQVRLHAFAQRYNMTWDARAVEVEVEWSAPKFIFSGFALGLRTEGQYFTDGTYGTVRFFGRIPIEGKRLGVYPSLGIGYGMPGPPMMRMRQNAWIFPVRTIDIPGTETKGDGIWYPEISFAIRVNVWRMSAESFVGVRGIRFGVQYDGLYRDDRAWVGVVGVRIGFAAAPSP